MCGGGRILRSAGYVFEVFLSGRKAGHSSLCTSSSSLWLSALGMLQVMGVVAKVWLVVNPQHAHSAKPSKPGACSTCQALSLALLLLLQENTLLL